MKLIAVALALAAVAFTLAPQKVDQMDRHIRHAISHLPKATTMTIEYREIKGLAGQFQWHIGDTQWWVRLHHGGESPMRSLDKKKKYRVTGIIVDQNYGVIEVWLQTLGEVPAK